MNEKQAGLRQLAAEINQEKPQAVFYNSLISAFQSDLEPVRIQSWDGLLSYCNCSAAPVGRFLLQLYEIESEAAIRASDALCSLLQILNHIQDIGKDWQQLNRIYMPQEWLEQTGAKSLDLNGNFLTPAWRQVLQLTLARCEFLFISAETLPSLLRQKQEFRLAAEATMILKIARFLADQLATGDPLARRIAPSRRNKLLAVAWGLIDSVQSRLAGFLKKSIGGGLSRSNFALPILFLPRRQKAAVIQLYRFCRLLDDCADGELDEAVKRAQLMVWRQAVQSFCHPTANQTMPQLPDSLVRVKALIDEYGLEWLDFAALFDGMNFDLQRQERLLSLHELNYYCDWVASSVGRIFLSIIGVKAEGASELAENLGRALQRVNILRDLTEDAARGRCSLPRESFPTGFADDWDLDADRKFDAGAILIAAESRIAIEALASETTVYFRRAARDLIVMDLTRQQRRRIDIFARVYHRLFIRVLQQLRLSGYQPLAKKARLSCWDWLMVVFGR